MGATPYVHPEREARPSDPDLYLVPEPEGEASNVLTPGERRLLPLLASELTLDEISAELAVPRGAITMRAVSIYRKLGIRSGG